MSLRDLLSEVESLADEVRFAVDDAESARAALAGFDADAVVARVRDLSCSANRMSPIEAWEKACDLILEDLQKELKALHEALG